jgi:hypothetical protein
MSGIKLPRLYLTAHAAQPMTDKMLGFDPIARMALETYRDTYNPLPTGNVDEWRAFFSLKNYKYLYAQIKKECNGMIPEEGELMDAMMWGYSTVLPRSDETDERRDLFGPDITSSYVREINKHVIEKMTAEVISANQQADVYYKYRMKGPINMQEDWGDWFVDTRTRLTSSRADMTYQLP